MKFKSFTSIAVAAVMLVAFSLGLGSAAAADAQASLAGVPVKSYHFKAMGSAMECQTCHGVAVPTERPDGQACLACHGPMSQIKTQPNADDKYPHQSHHYGDLLSCVACHAEHKPSKDLCSNCHKVKFKNLK